MLREEIEKYKAHEESWSSVVDELASCRRKLESFVAMDDKLRETTVLLELTRAKLEGLREEQRCWRETSLELETNKAEVELLRARVAELEGYQHEAKYLREEQEAWKKASHDLDASRMCVNGLMENWRKTFDDLNATRDDYQKLESANAVLKQELDACRSELDSYATELDVYRTTCRNLKANTVTVQESDAFRVEAERLKLRCDDLEASLKSTLEAKEKLLQELEILQQDNGQQIEKSRKEATGLRDELESLRRSYEELETCRSVLEDRRPRIITTDSFVKAPKEIGCFIGGLKTLKEASKALEQQSTITESE